MLARTASSYRAFHDSAPCLSHGLNEVNLEANKRMVLSPVGVPLSYSERDDLKSQKLSQYFSMKFLIKHPRHRVR